MMEETTELLKQAQYDVSDYSTWATKQFNKVARRSVTSNTTEVKTEGKKIDDKEKSTEIYSNRQKLTGPKIIDKIDLKEWEKFYNKKKS